MAELPSQPLSGGTATNPVPVPRSIKNGLQLRQANKESPFKAFSYTPARFSQTPLSPVDWRLLSQFHVESEHIRIHDLKEGDDLKTDIESYRAAHAKAVIIVNYQDTMTLSDEFSKSLGGFDGFLIAVLSSKDGASLYECLEEDEIFARLEVTSVDLDKSKLAIAGEDDETAVLEMDPTLPSSVRTDQPPKEKGFMEKFFGTSRHTFDLKGEIRKLMLVFNGDVHVMKPITNDAGTFTLVMSSFSQYEKSSKPDQSQVNHLIKTIFVPFFEVAFASEFPFYLILAYRFKHFRQQYECEELGPFISKCIDTFESLAAAKITETLLGFLQRKDFDIMFGSEEAGVSTFRLLATACKDLMNLSAQMKRSRSSGSSNHFIYTRMLWISVHLKCLSEKGIATKSDTDIWQNSLLKNHVLQSVVLNKETVSEFKAGVALANMLNLPSDLRFTAHHMTHFIGNEHFIRPLAQARDFITGLESNIKDDRELLVFVMINLRSLYSHFLSSSDLRNVCKASQEGTVLGVIEEGISFLDGMKDLWHKKRWHKGEQHNDFRHEVLKWLKLLLGIIKVTDPNAPSLLKKMLANKRNSVIVDQEFRKTIVEQLLTDTRKNFPNLTIQLFFPLYKSFRIWPVKFLHDFLNQYHIPAGVKINDATWSEFFNVVLERLPSEETQNYLLNFICKIAEKYKEDGRTKDFIPDMLQLNVPQLFVAPAQTEEGSDEENVGRKFNNFLVAYIQRNNLRLVILGQIQAMISHITDKKENLNFQWIILNVLQSVVVPELKSLENSDNEHLRSIVPVSVNMLVQDLSWFGPLSPRQKFCWGVVATACSKLAVTSDHFDWVQNPTLINQLGVVFNSYCNSRKLYGEKCMLTDHTPDEVASCPWDDVKKYFEWVRRSQDILCFWQGKFLNDNINYDELMVYASNNVALNALGRAVCAVSFVMEIDSITQIKETYRIHFAHLNVLLLRFVPGHPEVKYCTLPSLLNKYGIALPSDIQDVIVKHVVFPGDQQKLPKDQCQRNVIPPPQGSGKIFEPGQDISLNLSLAITLAKLKSLIENLQEFIAPFAHCLEMLVFFHLHQSEFFEKHVLKILQSLIELPSSSVSSRQPGFSIVPTLMPSVTLVRKDKQNSVYQGIPLDKFRTALERVKELLLRIVNGTATYSDIVADGAIKLESINTEKEFAILTSFAETMNMDPSRCEGLMGVRSMLELFQFTQHIQTMDAVFEQYGLENCSNDQTLKQLLKIMADLKPEGSRAKLTPLEAMAKMTFIKESLCLQNSQTYECLNLFPAVANSAAFYQFVRDKQFVGPRGHAIFREQYQLITAQLQHEEYDENVLNHLRAAFEFLAPFMEQDISFKDLMTRVSRLDTTHGLKQLETVNDNITLIRLWFSRAEGDTIENVANELDNILSTGLYQFQLSTGPQSGIFLIYKSQQKMRPQRKNTPHSQLEDSDKMGEVDPEKLGVTDLTTLPTVYPSPQPQTFPWGSPPLMSKDGETPPMSNITMGGVDQRWTSEQIADFVRKLGFLDTEKEGGDKIKQFLHLNSTANKMMDLFIKLHELGHPRYQEYHSLPILSCSVQGTEADTLVQELETTLQSWSQRVVALRQQYRLLLFISVPKLHCLHSLFDDQSFDLDAIVHEISFLFENDLTVRRKMKLVIQNALKEADNQDDDDRGSPMHVLGKFLQVVCSAPDLQPFFLKQRSARRRSLSVPRSSSHLSIASPVSSGTPIGLYHLHYAPRFSHNKLLRLITELYDGVPEPFEVFRCSPYTTHEELNLFMERVRHHPLQYLVLQVNRLPIKMQEVLMDLSRRSQEEEVGQINSIVHFVETAPSVLREVPWITLREYKDDGLSLTFDAAARICKRKIIIPSNFTCIQLVIGHAGNGKTHYIRSQLALCPDRLTIAVNEAFTPLSAIKKLRQLKTNTSGCAIFFNFTMIPYRVDTQDEAEKALLDGLNETISWFFFDLLILGYVEDPTTGASFRIPGGLEWAIYIEVPSLSRDVRPEESLHSFCDAIPALGLLGSPHIVHHATPYAVNDEVQLVCKYLRAFKAYRNGQLGINRLYKDVPPSYVPSGSAQFNSIVKFSLEENMSNDECHSLLTEFMPDHIQMTKITQKLFIKYMKRRCAFLDTLPAFNYNTGIGEPINNGSNKRTDTRQLGSSLMTTMLEEVTNFCHPTLQQDWSVRPHQQLIYDFRDGGGSFGLLSLNLETLPEENRKRFRNIGFELHSTADLQKREVLDQYLARALGLPSEEGNRLSAVDEAKYVLTLDYTIKMLNIHERYECGIPVIIKGETGVGKTALVDMLSRLWSNALLYQWNKERGIIFDNIRDLLSAKAEDSLDTYQLCLETMEALAVGKEVPLDNLVTLGELSDSTSTSGQFYSRLRHLLLEMANNPASALLAIPVNKDEKKKSREPMERDRGKRLDEYFQLARENNNSYCTAVLLQAVLKARVTNTFHKLNVHAALGPEDIKKFFGPVFAQAQRLSDVYQRADENKRSKIKLPFVTVFLDEVNTSSCLGLFKEILVDRTLDGETIPKNVFIVAACNPHRGNSMATHAAETWVRGSYYVRPLHPTLEFLIWDYGSLNSNQERDYITAKLHMLHNELPNIEVVTLTDLIVESQDLMRRYAARQLRKQGMKPDEVEVSSHSCVSQRDIQRVFTFYQWLMSIYNRLKQHGEEREDYNRRAVMVSLGIVYYMRLNSEWRADYQKKLDGKYKLPHEVNFTRAFFDELNWFCNQIELPPGIAKTQALKENLFATIVCTVTHTPLIIVGAPGSSKTLSFNLAIANLKGPESKMSHFRDTDIFKSLDPHFYQCSRRTTSNEIQTVFSRAINRQRSHSKFSLPIYCVVFMDEAGLPEESHESLKVLHYHLDKQEVSFVAITNHVLDAAKTNRAVSLFRPEVSNEDLKTLAKGCLCETPDNPPPELRRDLDIIVQFCPAYAQLMENKNMSKFFGLRDFIHFINYLRRRRGEMLNPQLVMEGLERNFNGIHWAPSGEKESFQWLCNLFLGKMKLSDGQKEPITLAHVKERSILEVLHQSLLDRPERGGGENEVRYKLIIDPSEDSSLVQLLMTFGVLDRKKTHMYVCSDFPGDGQLQKINTIAAIRHSAIEGHTVVMSQTDDIHESFYDLFNQRFRCIDDPEHGPRYYANIAIGAHLKPSRVHKDFQCVVVVRESEVKDTPAPFLNRFEKYCISHQTLLATAIGHLPPCMRVILHVARNKLNDFIRIVDGNSSLYGLKKETTLDSLLLSLLPPYGHTYRDTPPDTPVGDDVRIYLLQELLRSLRHSAGFAVPVTTVGELEMDANYLFPLLCRDASFDEAYQNLTIESSHKAVSEALKVLHTAPDPQEEGAAQVDMSPEACLAVGLLQQWLIRHMIKQLMRLMTSEAVTVHRKQIPASYIDNYLTHQQHFSIKRLIDFQMRALQSCKGDTHLCGSKLLAFTRSSPLIHELPSHYPQSIGVNSERIISELIHPEPEKVVLCKLSALRSRSNVQEVLKSFVHSQTKQVLVVIANMQEAKQETINHLRVMIEEAETQAPPTSCKLFVLLLHFPPAMFFDACYPSLFLRGWSHYYLDSLGHSSSFHPGTLDIEEWFQRCCFPEKEFTDDTIMNSCQQLLGEITPVLASHVTYGTRSNGPFTRTMKPPERNNKLRELLNNKGVGQQLLKLFRSCWRPSVMVDHLEKAAIFTRSHESSLNITDAVQAMFQSLFIDYMIIMISRINDNRNTDILFTDGCTPVVNELFLSLLETLSVPKLNQLKTLASSLPMPKPQQYQPMFPFFNLVFNEIEKLIEESKIVKAQLENLLDEGTNETDSTPPPSTLSQTDQEAGMKGMADHVIQRIEQELKETSLPQKLIYRSLLALREHPQELWPRYFTDFIHSCLHLEAGTSSLSHRIICAFFSDLQELEPISRLVTLHIYIEYNKLSLGNIASLLRPLEKIWRVAEDSPNMFTPTSQSPAKDFIAAIEQTKYPFGDPQRLSEFVISALFSALIGSVYPVPKGNEKDQHFQVDVLRDWYNTYLQVMTMPALVVHLYSIPLPPEEEAKFNIMHSTFLRIHSSPQPSRESLVGSTHVFMSMLSKYFKTDLTLKAKDGIPRLNECAMILGEVIKTTGDVGVVNNELARRIVEGLLDHFFSQHRPTYTSVDRDWFLKLANSQQEWRASDQLLNDVVISSSYSGDLVSAMESSLQRTRYRRYSGADLPLGCVSMFMFKLYLSRILGTCDSQSDSSSLIGTGPLLMYQPEPRQHIAAVLAADLNGDKPSSYIPVYYQDCKPIRKSTENRLMQQPLCHLYFLTVLEHLMTEQRDINSLVRLAATIGQLCKPVSADAGEKILLHIEKQAVIQCLLKQVAQLFNCDIDKPVISKDLTPVMTELNELLDDESMGGGLGGGHRLTLGMHLLRHLKSARKFIELVTTNYKHCQEIHCMQGFHQQLKTQTESRPYLFPFMQVEDGTVLSKLYHQVKTAMLNIDLNRGSQQSVDQLLNIADQCSKPRKTSRVPTESVAPAIDRRLAFRMMVWLVTYYEFFYKKKSSRSLSLVIAKQLKEYIKEDGVIRLMQCFLYPRWFIQAPESPNPLREDAQVLQVLPGGRVQKVQQEGPQVDPLYELLIPPQLTNRDQSDLDLCHCLANLIATIIGCQPQSNHLWYHLFSPHELKDTYMTGFMYKAKISPEGLLYDCGVELTADGQYGRPDYIKHATRGTYSLHSLYFLLWCNFGAFCMSLLTQTDAQSKIHGSIISDWQAIRHYCLSQLKTTWTHMRNNLGVSDEERSFLVTRCLMNMYQVNNNPSVAMIGKMRTSEELDEYETLWHERVFTPAWQELREKFTQYSILWQNQLFINIRHLESCYPQLPTEKEFVNTLQGEDRQGGVVSAVHTLKHFVLEKERLQVGGQLLPDLINLYQWIHTHLSYLISAERAYDKLTIGRVIALASRRGNPILTDLYNRVKDKYNQYVELVGGAIGQGACAAVRRGNRIYTIADDLPFLHFLSDSEDEGEGNDWLYAVIKDIVDSQNLLVQSLYADVGGDGDHPLTRLLPSDPAYIYATEANEYSCIVGKQLSYRGMSEFLQMVRSRLMPKITNCIPGTSIRATQRLMSISEESTMPLPCLSFDLSQLQEDVVTRYLSGRPIIKEIGSLRTVFKFRAGKRAELKRPLSDPMGGAYSLTSLEESLHPLLRKPLPDGLEKRLEYEFHSASYHSLTEIVVGLKTALGHLAKTISPNDDSVRQDLLNASLRSFMLNEFELLSADTPNVLVEIGIRSLMESQVTCLETLKLIHVYSTLTIFLRWVKEGLYDFSGLPMSLKVHLSPEDSAQLDQIPSLFKGSLSQLQGELKGLNEVLLHVEGYLIKEVSEQARKPIINLLIELRMLENEEIVKLIPLTVLVQHYVQLRLHMRRAIAAIEQKLAVESSLTAADKDKHVWAEYVDDLWNVHLTNLRDEGFMYIDPALLYDPTMGGEYGFYGEEDDVESTSELANDLNEDETIPVYDQDSYEPISMDFEDPLLLHTSSGHGSMITLASGFTMVPSPTHVPSVSTATGSLGPVESSVQETLKRGLEDPQIREEMLRLISQKKDVQQQAREWSPDKVVTFLESIKLVKYAQNFLEEEINGAQLLTADREVFKDLGVVSAIHSTQIAVLFRRELQGEKGPSCQMSQLFATSTGPKLTKYSKNLATAGIDVDMLLYAQQNTYLPELLKECGVSKALDKNRFDTALNELSPTPSPTTPTGKGPPSSYVAYSTPV